MTNQDILKSIKNAILVLRDLRKSLESITLEDLMRLGAPSLADTYVKLGNESRALQALVTELEPENKPDSQMLDCTYAEVKPEEPDPVANYEGRG